MVKPQELVQAEMIDGLCQRWGCPPSVILKEDAQLVLHTLALIAEAEKDKDKKQ